MAKPFLPHLRWPVTPMDVAWNSSAIDKVRPVGRSADFQSAVSPISNRQGYNFFHALGLYQALQAGSPAIQQIGNLRYFSAGFRGFNARSFYWAEISLCGKDFSFHLKGFASLRRMKG